MENQGEKYRKCDEYYKKILKGEKVEENEECYHRPTDFKDVENPLNDLGKCKLISQKRDSKYIFTYNPAGCFNYLERYSKYEGYADYIKNLKEFADLTKRPNCCNCISFALYKKPDDNINLPMRMRNVYLSVLNVEKYLPEWIVRVYLDPSIYNAITNLLDEKDELLKYYNFISNSQNAEIYTYLCQFYFDGIKFSDSDAGSISEMSIFRFIPLFDDSVNACVIHESSGLVGPVECNNIGCFVFSKKIFNFPVLLKGIEGANGEVYRYNDKTTGVSCVPWLQQYKTSIRKNFYSKNLNIIDMIPGSIFANLKIRKEKFVDSLQNLNLDIDMYVPSPSIREELDDAKDNEVAKNLSKGFDGILLLDVFRGVVSYPIKTEKLSSGATLPISEHLPPFQLIKEILLQDYISSITISVHPGKDFATIECEIPIFPHEEQISQERISAALGAFVTSVNDLLDVITHAESFGDMFAQPHHKKLLLIAAVEFYIFEHFANSQMYINYTILFMEGEKEIFGSKEISLNSRFSSNPISLRIFKSVYDYVNSEQKIRRLLGNACIKVARGIYDGLIKDEIGKIEGMQDQQNILEEVRTKAVNKMFPLAHANISTVFNQRFRKFLARLS